MNGLLRDELRALMEKHAGPCVSLYLPTRRDKEGAQQNAIRLKNLLRAAEEKLLDQGLKAGEVRRLLEPGWIRAGERPFWQQQEEGLAVFLGRGFHQFVRSPLSLAELVRVSGAFHLAPLVPLLARQPEFCLLGLGQKGVRLLRGSRHELVDITPEGVPAGVEEPVKLEVGGRVRGGTRSAAAHAGGAGSERSEILRYFRAVDQALRETLRTAGGPVVLAGVPSLLPLYREVNTSPNLMDESIAANPGDLSVPELLQRAWAIVEPHFDRERLEAADQYLRLAGTGRTAHDLAEILPAARHGRVEALFVNRLRRQWGTFHPDTGAVEQHLSPAPGDEDLLDLAALETYSTGGTVFTVGLTQMPDETVAAAAVLRY